MPTLFNANYLRPKDDDEFEEMICDICELEWGDPNTARFGRSGQKQHGVDVYGRPQGSTKYHGAQCKLRSTDKQLSEDEIETEVREAKIFSSIVGPLKRLIIATDAPRDTHTQTIVSKISEREIQDGGFEVGIWFWSDIIKRLVTQRRLLIKYYRAFYANLTNLEIIDRLIDTPLQLAIIETDNFFQESELDIRLRFRGIRILRQKNLSTDIDGVIIHYIPNSNEVDFVKLNQIAITIAQYQGIIDAECPIFVLCPNLLHSHLLSTLQSLTVPERKIQLLDTTSTLNAIADNIFDVIYDFGYERRGKLPIIDITIRSLPQKPDTALLDVDWQSHLGTDLHPLQSDWHELFVPAIEVITTKLTQSPDKTLIQIDSRLPLPAAFAVGYYLNVRVATIGVWSRRKGASDFKDFFWLSTGNPADIHFVEKIIPSGISGSRAGILEISVQRSIHADVLAFVNDQGIDVDVYVVSRMFDNEDEVLIDEGVAVAYADYVGYLIRRVRSDYGITDFHLFIQLPSALGILISRNLQACGRLNLYWYDNPTYKFAFTLK